MNITITPAHHWQAMDLAPRLRATDKREVMFASGMTAHEALKSSLLVSDEDLCWCAMVDDSPEVLWGCAPLDGRDDVGIPWLLGSDRVPELGSTIWPQSKADIARMHARYDYLINYVHEDNIVSLKWLTGLGFSIDEAEPFGLHQEPFHRILSVCANQLQLA